MRILTTLILLLFLSDMTQAQLPFKSAQSKFPRVKDAYTETWPTLQQGLKAAKFATGFKAFIAAYKQEGLLELWLKNKTDKSYRLFKTYKFCKHSGTLGPKVQENDYQTPEGFYEITAFNPQSSFHLSLGLNYPNAVDLARSGTKRPGSDIYIHGHCVTVGCIPLDEKIKELYVLAVEARNGGQTKMPVFLFPFKMTKANLDQYGAKFPQHKAFWTSLKPAYDLFEQHKILPVITEKSGVYVIRPGA